MAEFYTGEGTLTIEQVDEPTFAFADLAQEIGYKAWYASRGFRTEQEILMMFAQFGEIRREHAIRDLDRMERRADAGHFAGAIALLNGEPVGYTWAADDMSGDELERLMKRQSGRKPYAWVPQVNVLPDHQHLGIGTDLLVEVLETFNPVQKPTAYVFDESRRSLNWLLNLGFVARPDAPVPKDHYFGHHHPVFQWRLEAPNVPSVREQVKVRREIIREMFGDL